MVPERENRLRQVYASLTALTDGQLGWIETMASQFHKPAHFHRLPDSDLVNGCILQDFGDALRIHHGFSKEPFSKDKFEYAFERVLNLCGILAMLAPRGNPGHDITINGVRFSLKTQADRGLAVGHLHISKFIELGKGAWTDKEKDLIGLRLQFLRPMRSYHRILSLRRLPATVAYTWHYELVEIPKSLLQEARTCTLRMIHDSKQFPKPGYCDVVDAQGELKFQLYFDGGTERKLQIRRLGKSWCIVRAEWRFETGLSETDSLSG